MTAASGMQDYFFAKADALNEVRNENAAAVATLTRAMRRGDEAAWVRFHQEYSGRIHRYLLVLLKGDHESASEILQVTFTRIARYMREFDDEKVMWHWLTRIARTATIDELRKRGRREESLRELAEASTVDEAEETQWPELLNRALTRIEV